jgi:hypothetical protein
MKNPKVKAILTKRSTKSVFDFMDDVEAVSVTAKGFLDSVKGDTQEQLKLARVLILSLNDIITQSTHVSADVAAKVIGLCDIGYMSFWDAWEPILEHGDEIYSKTFFREFVCHEMGYSRMKKEVFIGIERLGWGDWKQYIFKFGRKVVEVDFSGEESLKLNVENEA